MPENQAEELYNGFILILHQFIMILYVETSYYGVCTICLNNLCLK